MSVYEKIRGIIGNEFVSNEISLFINPGNKAHSFVGLHSLLETDMNYYNYGQVLNIIFENLTFKDKVRFTCDFHSKTRGVYAILLKCMSNIKIEDNIRDVGYKKKLIKWAIEKHKQGLCNMLYYIFIHYNSKILRKHIIHGITTNKYDYLGVVTYGIKGNITAVLYLSRYNSNIAIMGIKNGMINPHDFITGLMVDKWDENIRTNNVKLLKVCFARVKYSSNFDIRSRSYGNSNCHDVYCYIKYGMRLETAKGKKLSNYMYNASLGLPINIMILHRRYRDIDILISFIHKFKYKVLNITSRWIIGKNLSKLALYYV
jgi:hypothetical protein